MSTAVLRDIGTSPVDAIIARIIRTTRCIAIVGLCGESGLSHFRNVAILSG